MAFRHIHGYRFSDKPPTDAEVAAVWLDLVAAGWLDPGPASPAAPMSDEGRAAIARFLEVEHAEMQRVSSDGQARSQSPGT